MGRFPTIRRKVMSLSEKIKMYFASSLFAYGFLHYPRERKKEIVNYPPLRR